MIMISERWIRAVVASGALLCTTHAHAHFKLLKPASWLNEDQLGGPQKGSPCGPGNSKPFIGDDKQPNPVSDAVTTFHAGETITVEMDETVYHPGYFRISLAKTTAAEATSEDFPDPALTDPVACYYDKAAVKSAPHDNVLGDGLFTAEAKSAVGRQLKQEVKLPDEPCDQCTLQIVQVMDGHGASSCFYYHCADIKIVAADGDSGGAGSAGRATSNAAGSAGGATPASSEDDGGCSVSHAGAQSSTAAAWCLSLGLAVVLARRRRSAHR
jgi:MYXO-CTERM domain-containing protein